MQSKTSLGTILHTGIDCGFLGLQDLPDSSGIDQKVAHQKAQLVPVPSIYDASAYVDRAFRSDGNPKHHPLLSQDLAELALQLSIVDGYSQGRDRIAFRQALSGVLPNSVLTRHIKSDHTGVLQLGLRKNLNWIEELTLNGWLAKNRLILKDQLRLDLRRAAQGFSLDMWPILNLVSIEMWCDAWRIGP